MKIRSKCVGVGGVCRGCGRTRCRRTQARLVRRTPAHPAQARPTGPAYMSMATITLVRAAMTHAVTNM